MDVLPDTLTVRVSKAIKDVDRICSHQDLGGQGLKYFDRIMGSMVEMLERPNLTGKLLDDAVGYILVTHRLNDLTFGEDDLWSFRLSLTSGLIHLRQVFDDLNPYVHGRLVYRYKERRGQQSVILQLHTQRPAAYAGVRDHSR